jgi:hypothetical protein
MEKYGGKFEKRREETRERMLRENDSFIRNLCISVSLILWISVFVFQGYKYRSAHQWNDDIVFKTRAAWRAMDVVETDILNAVLFLKGCRKDMVFQETADGFELHTVEMRNQSMEILQNVERYSDTAVAAYLGSGVRPGDFLMLCNQEEEKKVQLQVIRNNPKFNFHYLIFPDAISLSNPELPAALIKFTPIQYRWEKVSEENYKLFRSVGSMEAEIYAGIKSYKINYQFKDEEKSFLTINLVLNEKFKNGENIQIRRHIPLESFERIPKELEGKVP